MKLSELDRKLLYELDADSRQKLSTIARKLNTSEQRLKYRLGLLTEGGIITGFISFIDITKLGYLPFRVYIQYRNVSPAKEKEIVAFLASNPYVQWMASFSGSWDLEIVLFAKSFFHYLTMMRELFDKYGDYIMRRSLSVSTNNYYFKRRYLTDKKLKGPVMTVNRYGGEPETYSLDEKDTAILEILSDNARASLVEVASQIKVTPNAAKERIRRLKQRGILQAHTIVLDSDKMGRQFYKILIAISNFNKEIESKIISFCEKFPNIWFFIVCDGEWNVEFEIEVKENSELRNILREFRNEFQDRVLRYDSLLAYKIDKMSYFPAHIKKKR